MKEILKDIGHSILFSVLLTLAASPVVVLGFGSLYLLSIQ